MSKEVEVILVDENDVQIGTMEKMKAHQEGKLHRAFSVIAYNSKGEWLLQKRAATKYHSANLWTNTCCSHPIPDKEMEACILERMQEEMGFSATLEKLFNFTYLARLNAGLTEYEFDHVYQCQFDGEPVLNPDEASDYKWVNPENLRLDMEVHSENYTIWFKLIVDKIFNDRFGK